MFETDRFIADCRIIGLRRRAGRPGYSRSSPPPLALPQKSFMPWASRAVLGQRALSIVGTHHFQPDLVDRRCAGYLRTIGCGPCQSPSTRAGEDNIFWRRPAGVPTGRIEAAGAKSPQ